MAFSSCCKIKFTKKQLSKLLIFFSGFVFLSLQIYETFQIFIEQRSTFITSKEHFDSLASPTIIFCLLYRMNISLNEHFNVTIKFKKDLHDTILEKNLTLGENFDSQKKLIITVEELLTPYDGLCYTMVDRPT